MISSLLGYTEGFYGTSLLYAVPLLIYIESVRKNSICKKTYFASLVITLMLVFMYILHNDSWSFTSFLLVLKYIVGVLIIGCSAFYLRPYMLEKKMKIILLILLFSCLPLFFVDSYNLGLIKGSIHKTSGLIGIPEMRGLFWNSNYLSICGALLGGYFLGKKDMSRLWFLLSSLVCVFGGSRSGILIILVVAALHFRSLRFLFALAFLSIVILNYSSFLVLYEIFSDRGLTGRELLFNNALILVKQNIWLGIGYDYGDILLEMGSFTSTVQNTFLSNTLKYGVIVSLIEFIVSLVVLVRLIRRKDEFRYIFLVILIDSLFRTYSFGGIGLLSYFYTFIILREILMKKKSLTYA